MFTKVEAYEPRRMRLCEVCNLDIDRKFVRFRDAAYHPDCFRCKECDCIITGKFYPHVEQDEEVLLCKEDYYKKLDLVCTQCGGVIEGRYVNIFNKKYHLDHFACSVCLQKFEESKSYFKKGDLVYCQKHYSELFAPKCKGCDEPVVKNFVELCSSVGSNEKSSSRWHPQCFMVYRLWNTRVRLVNAQGSVENAQMLVPSILKTLTQFEESTAECISDMFIYFSNALYKNAIFQAARLVSHICVLLNALEKVRDGMSLSSSGDISTLSEPKQLVKKVICYFSSFLEDKINSETVKDRKLVKNTVITVTNLAKTLKDTIKVSLQCAIRLENELLSTGAIQRFLDSMDLVKQSDFFRLTVNNLFLPLRNQKCKSCDILLNQDSIVASDACWHSSCLKCITCSQELAENLELWSINGSHNVYCPRHYVRGNRRDLKKISIIACYTLLLNISLKKMALAYNVHGIEGVDAEKSECSEGVIGDRYLDGLCERDILELPCKKPTLDAKDQSKNPLNLSRTDYWSLRQLAVRYIYTLMDKRFTLNQLMRMAVGKSPRIWERMFDSLKKPQKMKTEGLFGVPLEILVERYGVYTDLGAGLPNKKIPKFLDFSIRKLLSMDLKTEGIFRKNGNISKLKEMSQLLDSDPNNEEFGEESSIQIAALLKKFLRELPEPILTRRLHIIFLATQTLETEEARKKALYYTCLLLPKPNIDCLSVLLWFLRQIADNGITPEGELGNRMNITSLATIMAPSFLKPKPKSTLVGSFLQEIEVIISLLKYQNEFWSGDCLV